MSDKPIQFIFVYAKSPKEAQGWWLKISSMEELEAYIQKTRGGKTTTKGFELYSKLYMNANENGGKKPIREILEEMPPEKRHELMMTDMRAFNSMMGGIMMAEKMQGTILDGFRAMNMEIGMTYMRHIKEDGVCFINKNGGCNSIIEYDTWCRKNDLVWPDFTRDQIRTKQYDGGTHWYAFIGDCEVRNEDGGLQFPSKMEAYEAACAVMSR